MLAMTTVLIYWIELAIDNTIYIWRGRWESRLANLALKVICCMILSKFLKLQGFHSLFVPFYFTD